MLAYFSFIVYFWFDLEFEEIMSERNVHLVNFIITNSGLNFQRAHPHTKCSLKLMNLSPCCFLTSEQEVLPEFRTFS